MLWNEKSSTFCVSDAKEYWSVAHAPFTHDGDPAHIRSLTERVNNHFHLLMRGDKNFGTAKLTAQSP